MGRLAYIYRVSIIVRYTWHKRYVLKCKLGKIYNIVNILKIKGDTHALSREMN